MVVLASLFVLIFLALVLTAYAFWRGAPWAPTPSVAVNGSLARARVGPNDVVIDVGAGDGRVLLAAARLGARAIGYELSPFLWLVAWLRTRSVRRQVLVRLADGFQADLSVGTVVFSFLRPATVSRLVGSLGRTPSVPTRCVLSYAFPLPFGVPPDVLRLPRCAPMYLYWLHGDGGEHR